MDIKPEIGGSGKRHAMAAPSAKRPRVAVLSRLCPQSALTFVDKLAREKHVKNRVFLRHFDDIFCLYLQGFSMISHKSADKKFGIFLAK